MSRTWKHKETKRPTGIHTKRDSDRPDSDRKRQTVRDRGINKERQRDKENRKRQRQRQR